MLIDETVAVVLVAVLLLVGLSIKCQVSSDFRIFWIYASFDGPRDDASNYNERASGRTLVF
jgi:hypothetical protein